MRLARAATLGGAGAIALVTGIVYWNATKAVREASSRVSSQSQIEFETRNIDAPPAGFELLPANAGYNDAALYQGVLYAGGAAGLVACNLDGTAGARYRPGFELPGAPVTALTVAALASGNGPELIAATDGAGLVRFDGHRFRHAWLRDAELRKTVALAALPTGQVLVGTATRGVMSFDGDRFVWFHESLRNLKVSALLAVDGEVWVGTPDRGVVHWTAGRVESFAENEGLPDAHVLSLERRGTDVFVGTAAGVVQFSGGKLARTAAPGIFARALAVAQGSLVVGTVDEGVMVVGKRATSLPAGELQDVRRLLATESDLFALAGGGVYVAAKGQWRELAAAEPGLLRDTNVSAVAVDASGRLWTGYFDRGLDVRDAGGHLTHVEAEPVLCVNRIVPDPKSGSTLVATANGLAIFDGAAHLRQVMTRKEGLIASHVTDVALRDNGWAVATPAGITFLGAGGARSLYAFHGLVNNHVYALGVEGTRVMAGTLGGLSMLDGETVRASFTTANSGLKHNWITAVASLGGEWVVGTYGDSVWRFDATGHWRRLGDLPKGLVVNPNAIAVTPDRIYIGTLDAGLAVMQRGTERWSLRTRGLPSLNVTAIACRDGALYIGTGNGLVRAREEALESQ